MLNRLISLVFLLSFLNIGIAYSETNFLFPQKKPSIFKKNEKQLQENISKNLPVPKPRLEKKDDVKPQKILKEKPVAKPENVKENKDIKKKVLSSFILPKKKPITYKVSSKEIVSSKVLNKKDFERAKETIKFIKSKKME